MVKNDSFFKLSKKYGVTLDAIVKANPGVDSSRLKVGQKLVIPVAAAPTAAHDAAAAPGTGEIVYVVKAGDTLAKIARAHGVTLKELKAANGLKTDAIKAGQKLKVPARTAPAAPPEPAPVTPPSAVPAPVPPPPAGSPPTPAPGTKPSPA